MPVSDSDSDLSETSTPVPPDHELEKALRHAVIDGQRNNPDTLTMNQVRNTAEKKLKLAPDFFKNDSHWKSRSKEIVNDQLVSILLPKRKSISLTAARTSH
jgi:hypothetical protein